MGTKQPKSGWISTFLEDVNAALRLTHGHWGYERFSRDLWGGHRLHNEEGLSLSSHHHISYREKQQAGALCSALSPAGPRGSKTCWQP